MNNLTRSYPIGGSCPWRIVAPAQMTPIARTLEAARTRPNVRAMLAAEAAKATRPEPTNCGPSTDSEPIVFAGIEVDAPGFASQAQFEQAMMRALIDELQVKPHEQSDRYVVGHPHSHAYLTSRDRCSCKAGVSGQPCKHRATLILHLDIRQPAIAKQWQKLRIGRSASVAA